MLNSLMLISMISIVTESLTDGPTYLQLGDLPRAVAWFQNQLDRHPWDRERQLDLLEVRKLVNAPSEYPPPALTGWRYRISPLDLLIAASIAGLLIAIGGSIWWRTRSRRARFLAIVGGCGWITLLVISYLIQSPTETVIIIRESMLLRKGNAESYPAVHPVFVPKGSEGILLSRRGEWCRVQIGQFRGWVPTKTCL